MRVLYIDCESGASGDMMLGAFINLGVPADYLVSQLNTLGLEEYTISVKERSVGGLLATDVDVVLNEPENEHINPYSGNFRNYGDIKEILKNSHLRPGARSLAEKIFHIKALAEAKVHSVPLDEVKFHEAGAVDSVVDIVGAAICRDYIRADKVVSKMVPTGYGFVDCACGRLRVPVPAVRQILENTGIPHYTSKINQEILTPTGASIIAGIADKFSSRPPKGETIRTGYGTGKRDTGLRPLKLVLCSC